jgi:hypothetical protein
MKLRNVLKKYAPMELCLVQEISNKQLAYVQREDIA